MKNIRIFYLKIFHLLVVKFSVHLNRHVFVMPGALVMSTHSICFVIKISITLLPRATFSLYNIENADNFGYKANYVTHLGRMNSHSSLFLDGSFPI